MPKVKSPFPKDQEVILLQFFPNPESDEEIRLHNLDVRRALLLYLDRVSSFIAADSLSTVGQLRGVRIHHLPHLQNGLHPYYPWLTG